MAFTSFRVRGGATAPIAAPGAPSFTTSFKVSAGATVLAGVLLSYTTSFAVAAGATARVAAPGPPSFTSSFKVGAGPIVRVSAPGGAGFTTSFKISAGAACKVRSPSWDDGSTAPKRKVPWLPNVQVKPVRPDGSWNPDVWRALNYLFNEVLGGINAPTIAEVTQTVTTTQAQVVATQANAENAMNYAAGIAAAVTATAEVTQSAGLPGSGSIPAVPSKPGTIEP